MKKKLSLLLVPVFALGLVLPFTGCEEESFHTHSVVIDEAVAPTCSAVGKTEGRHCSACGAVIVAQESVNKLQHEFDETFTCKICGFVAEGVGEIVYTLSEDESSYLVSGLLGEGMIELVIPESHEGKPITGIAYGAFLGNVYLKSVLMSKSVTEVGAAAFDGCTRLETLVIGENVKTIGEGAFSGCKNLTVVKVPEGVTTIGSYIFNQCERLKEVSLPSTVNAIGRFAFFGCVSLQTIAVAPSNQTYTSIDDNLYHKQDRALIHYSAGRVNTALVVPEGVEEIADFALYQCTTITSVTLPDSVKRIGNRAFCGCSRLATANLGNGVLSIAEAGFSSCSSLTEISLGTSLTYIEDGAFFDCWKLKNLKIPQSVNYIGYDAFDRCTSLHEKTAGIVYVDNWAVDYEEENVTYLAVRAGTVGLAERAFYEADRMTGVTLPNGVKYICDDVFYGCTRLLGLELATTVEEIGANAFAYCKWMKSVFIPASVKKIAAKAFYGCSELKEAIFENGNGWTVVIGENDLKEEVKLNAKLLSDKTVAASYLTNGYLNHTWSCE